MTRYVRTAGVEAAPLNGEAILYDPAARRFCQLNATAACVWERLERPATATEIAIALRDRFAVPDTAQVEADVTEALRQLVELKLAGPAPEGGAH
jgi:hypothetical protein